MQRFVTTAGFSLPGQLKMVGVRTPPSYSEPLPPRSLPLEAGGFAPSATPPLSARSSSERAPVANRRFVAPPLSLLKMISVLSRKPLLIQRGHDPTDLVVQAVIIAAYVRRFSSLIEA